MLHTIMIGIHLKYCKKSLISSLFAGPTGTVRRESRCVKQKTTSPPLKRTAVSLFQEF